MVALVSHGVILPEFQSQLFLELLLIFGYISNVFSFNSYGQLLTNMTLITLFFDVRLLFAAIASAIAAYASWLVVQDVRVKLKYRLPPQVPGLPLVGNILQMPKTDQGPYLQKIGRKYGEM